jgi:hypothetical protein
MGSPDTIKRSKRRYKCLAWVLLILINGGALKAQIKEIDSLSSIIDSVYRVGSTKSAWVLEKADSLKNRLKLTKVDSVEAAAISKIDSATRKLNNTIDSLNNLPIPGEQYAAKVDSLFKQYRQRLQTEVTNRSDSLGIGVKQKLEKIDSVYAARTRVLDSIIMANTGKSIAMDGKFEGIDLKLPVENKSLDLGIDSPLNVQAVSAPDVGNPINPKLNIDLPEVDGLEKLNDVKEVASDVANMSKEVTEVSEEAKKLKEGDHSERLEQEIGNQAKRVDEVNQLSKQTKVVDELKDQVESTKDLNDPEVLQEKAKKKFVDHFAGKEEMIQKDLDEIGKLQMKYRDIPDARNLPKRRPNEMKDKPIVERLVPAVYFQVYNSDNTSADVAPYLGFQISGRITAGLSIYERVLLNGKEVAIKVEDLYGYRLSQNFKLASGLYTHLEFDHFEDKLVKVKAGQGYTGSYGWNTKLNFGIQKTYSIGRRFKGSALLLYDVKRIKEFPGSRNSGFRFGFEYQIKKRAKKTKTD